MSDFTIILRSLSSRMFSTVTTVLTVAVAVSLMLTLLSMRDSGRRAFSRGTGNMHLLVSRDSDPLTALLNGVFYARSPRNFIDWKKFQEIASDPRLSSEPGPGLSPGFVIPTQLGDSYRGHPVLAAGDGFFALFEPEAKRPWAFAQGKAFDGDFKVVLGATAARETGHRLGDRIVLTHGTPAAAAAAGGHAPHEHAEYKFEVVGILSPTGSAHDRALFVSIQSAWILHAHDMKEAAEREAGGDHDHAHEELTTAADLKDEHRRVTGILIRTVTRGESDVSPVMQQVFDELRRDPTITVAQPVQEITRLFTIVSNIDQILLAMAAVVMVSSGIGIMLALYNSMEQRRRQIAVLRVLGCSRGRIFGLVLTESALLGVLGAIGGLALCLVGVRLVAAVMKARLGLVIEPAFGADWVLVVAVGTVLLAAVAGVVPAVMAYRTSVARSLRPLG